MPCLLTVVILAAVQSAS